MPFIDRLKAVKKEKGLTNAEIAQLSDLPVATITRIFNGSTPNPTFESFARISIAMGVSLDEIAGLRHPDTPPVDAHIENTLTSYSELLKEKDERIREKDDMIKMLQEINRHDRIQKMRLLWFIGIFVSIVVAAIITVLLIDACHGDWGYFRY